LIILSVVSLSAIITIPLVRPDIEVPDLLSQILTLTIGYFGGTITAFMRFNISPHEIPMTMIENRMPNVEKLDNGM
jgi:hypothetical protein